MVISKTSVTHLKKIHPHSTELLKVFAPLMNAQQELAQAFVTTEIMHSFTLDMHEFTSGKPLLDISMVHYPAAFSKKACTKLCTVASRVLPQQSAAFSDLKAFFKTHKDLLRDLTNFRLQGNLAAARPWAQQHAQQPEPTALLSMLLGGAVAQGLRAALLTHVKLQPEYQQALAGWSKGYCPVCGSLPHGSSLKNIEGERYLHCSLCAHSWRYSRTACPLCEQTDSEKISLFYIEDHPEERAEACECCKHYLLSVDTRKLAEENPPLDLYFLCMGPLDMLLQEKGYMPADHASPS